MEEDGEDDDDDCLESLTFCAPMNLISITLLVDVKTLTTDPWEPQIEEPRPNISCQWKQLLVKVIIKCIIKYTVKNTINMIYIYHIHINIYYVNVDINIMIIYPVNESSY